MTCERHGIGGSCGICLLLDEIHRLKYGSTPVQTASTERMTVSNYPPGVTGSEPAIAGYPEGTYNAPPCTGYMPDDSRAIPPYMISELAAIQERLGKAETFLDATRVLPLLERLRLEMLDLPKAVDVECGYEGTVDAQWSGDRRGNGEYFWTCPRCGSEQSESREAGDDHPDL